MHTRRIITFLLGIWIGCNVLLGYLTLENIQSPNLVLSSPVPAAGKIIEKVGQEPARELLRHLALQQTRLYLDRWGYCQLALGALLVLLLLAESRKRLFPMLLTAIMLGFTLFQQFGLLPELAFVSREADFPPASADFELRTKVYTLSQFYIGCEAVKLLTAGVLVSYLFVFYGKTNSVRRRRSTDFAEVD